MWVCVCVSGVHDIIDIEDDDDIMHSHKCWSSHYFELMIVDGLVFVSVKEVESLYNLLLLFFTQFSPLPPPPPSSLLQGEL